MPQAEEAGPPISAGERILARWRAAARKLRSAPARAPGVARALVTEPAETLLYLPEQVSHWRHRPVPYHPEDDWGPVLHEMIGRPWPCPEVEESGALWGRINAELAARGLDVGRWTYGVYSDSDPALAAAVWCTVRHLSPQKVVETGVARGITSRMILEGMLANGNGHLWSIDLPYLFGAPALASETGAAVTDDLRSSWTYIRGSSRRRLRPLVSDLGALDMFVHDSLHTVRNVLFEMATAWEFLRDGGVMLIDDVDSAAFRDFSQRVGAESSAAVFRSGDGPWMFGVIAKRPHSPSTHSALRSATL